jgi:archaetidylinositol phosphate synthase
MAEKVRRRLNEGFIGPLERPVLLWLATRLPRSVTPDQLTVCGLGGSGLVFAGYVLSWQHSGFLWLANFGLIVNWFGDSLDGTLARYRRAERPRYGFFIDHTTDLFTQVMLACGLGLSPYVHFEVACLALVTYLLLAVFTFVRMHTSGILQISYNGFGPTEVRLGMILFNIWFFVSPPGPIFTIWVPLSAAELAIMLMSASTFIFLIIAVRLEAQRLGVVDPPRFGNSVESQMQPGSVISEGNP